MIISPVSPVDKTKQRQRKKKIDINHLGFHTRTGTNGLDSLRDSALKMYGDKKGKRSEPETSLHNPARRCKVNVGLLRLALTGIRS